MHFMLRQLVPAVLEHDWVEGAEHLRSPGSPCGTLYGSHGVANGGLGEWEVFCTDPLVDAAGAVAGSGNRIGWRGLKQASQAEHAEQLTDFWVDCRALLDMCCERAPEVTAAMLADWSESDRRLDEAVKRQAGHE